VRDGQLLATGAPWAEPHTVRVRSLRWGKGDCTMKRRWHTPEQVIRKPAEGDEILGQGQSGEEVCRHLEITESTWHRQASVSSQSGN
jgi:hypothetical protein